MDGSIMQRKLSQDTAPIRCTRLATVCVTARCTSACARTVRLLIDGVDEGRRRERAASLTPLRRLRSAARRDCAAHCRGHRK